MVPHLEITDRKQGTEEDEEFDGEPSGTYTPFRSMGYRNLTLFKFHFRDGRKDRKVGNKLVIIDVDALLGTKNKLHHPCCLKPRCDKATDFRGKDAGCKFGRWCANAHYNPENIAAYRSVLNVTEDNCYMAVVPALEKLAEAGWLFSLWTTRPRRQTFHIISVLKRVGIWHEVQMSSGTPLLLNNSDLPADGSFSPATEKLALFEKTYGKICDPDWPIVAIESDPLEASILQHYGGKNVVVHLSPKIWLDILMPELEILDEMLVCEQFRESMISTVNQAS